MRRLKYMILLVFVFISGCWDRMEMNDLAFVMGTAMDLSDDGNLLCSLQIATPSSEGGMSGGGSGSKDKFFVISVEGKSGNEIHQKLQKKSSRMLFYSHRSIVFISERLAKHGIQGVLDIFTHDPRNRLKTYVMVVKGEAGKNILQMNYPLKQVPIEAVREMENSGDDLAVTLKDFFISVQSEGVQPVVGVIESDIDSKDPHKQLFRLTGAGVFKDLKLSGLLDINETLGLMWVTDKLKFGRITANLPEGKGEVGMLITHAERKIVTQTGHDPVQFKIQLEGQGSLTENNSGLDINEPKNLKLITKALEDAAKKQVQDVIFKIQKKYKVDSVGFGHEIYKHNPEKWANLKNQWDTRFPEADISVEVNLIIKGEEMVHSSFESKEKESE
ncbi:Ger(x)C family spore germination protein [Paenibacillus andongensis]|uniref:Ger(x)C family spore germination protein n=1 Tax=Paenibacillus andongensis TaxID=2975482 RepID=UPI0021BA4B67|nr:Ger(x)C family spore germination protein [Paenibacillus andongensis]